MSSASASATSTRIHISALDGIVNTNSLFTLAVFLGLTWNPKDPSQKLVAQPECSSRPHTAEDLVSYHVYSFSCFLFSSLVSLGLKQALKMHARPSTSAHRDETWAFEVARVDKTVVRAGYVVSAVGSVCGSVFLMLSLVCVVEVKLGVLGCGGDTQGYGAVVPLLVLVPCGLLIYVSTAMYAFTR